MSDSRHSGRNGKIELMRFLCAVIILLYHFNKTVGDDRYFFLSGALAVEFFFVLSGYLMMASIDRAPLEPGQDLGRETVHFLGKKVKALFPELLITYVVAFAVRFASEERTLAGGVKLLTDSIWELGLLRQSGLQLRAVNDVTWYLSSMLICMALLYPLLRKYPSLMGRVIVPVVSVLVLGYLCQNYSTPISPTKWLGWTFKGTPRAFGELGLGVACYHVTKQFRQVKLTHLGKVCVTWLEPVLYSLYIAYMFFYKSSKRDWILIPLLMLAIGITFSGQTLFPHILDNAVTGFLGKFSLSLYLSHHFWAKFLPDFFPKGASWAFQFQVYLGAAAATAVVTYALSEWIRRRHIGTKLLRLFVVQGEQHKPSRR